MKRILLMSVIGVLVLAGLLLAQSDERAAPANRSPASGAQANSPAKADGKKEAAKPHPMNVTPEREAAVRTFVELNHAELADLLTHLKANQPKEYERAVRELHRVTERLAQIQERDPAHYELEVKLWTAQSRVQLLTAKLKMGATDELKNELRGAIGAHADARLAVLKHEREKATQRLAKMNAEIARFEEERQKVIDKQLETLIRTAQSGGAKGELGGGKNKPGKVAGKGSGSRQGTAPGAVNAKSADTPKLVKPAP